MVLGPVLLVFLAAGGGAGLSSPPAQSARSTGVPSFEVASVRLNTSGERPRVRVNAVPQAGRLTITAMTVKGVILAAYGLQSFELQDNDSPILNQQSTSSRGRKTRHRWRGCSACCSRCWRSASA